MHSAKRASERELKNIPDDETTASYSRSNIISSRYARLENTFRTEPTKLFPYSKARRIIEDLLNTHLEGMVYSDDKCPKLAVELCDLIRIQVKQVSPLRYKIAVMVHIGQRDDQALVMAGRCLWNTDFDTYTTASFTNNTIFAVGLVFACYYE